MPSKSPAQRRLMQAAAHTKGGFGGVPQKVGKEFVQADKGQTMKKVKKATGGSMDPRDYDSDWDYKSATGQLKEESDEPEQEYRIRPSVLNKQKTIRRKNAADAAMSFKAKRSGDKESEKKIQDRWARRETSESLKRNAQMSRAPKANEYRKEWSEKIGKGKPAPFKSGGSTCW